MIYVMQGQMQYIDGERTINMNEGYIYLLPARIDYTISFVDNYIKYMWFFLLFEPPITNNIESVQIIGDSPEFHLLKAVEGIFKPERRDVRFVNGIVQSLIYQFSKKVNLNTLNDSSINKALQYIHCNYNTDINIEDLCKLLSLDYCYFIRRFKKKMGIPPIKYLIKYRLNASIKLLTEDNSLSQISIMVGFPNLKAYSWSFKKEFKMTPSEYRKNRLNIHLH
jgi:AraC-like DNA-binding protein